MEIASVKETNRGRFMYIVLTNIEIRVTFGESMIYIKEKVEIHLVQYNLCSCHFYCPTNALKYIKLRG
jgi:hypothetical protein